MPKQEFVRMQKQAEAYRSLVAKMFELTLQDPVGEVVGDLKTTGLYTNAFLRDLEGGLRKSSYAKHYVHQALKKGS